MTRVCTLNLMQTHAFRHSDWLVSKRQKQAGHLQRQASSHIPVQHSDRVILVVCHHTSLLHVSCGTTRWSGLGTHTTQGPQRCMAEDQRKMVAALLARRVGRRRRRRRRRAHLGVEARRRCCSGRLTIGSPRSSVCRRRHAHLRVEDRRRCCSGRHTIGSPRSSARQLLKHVCPCVLQPRRAGAVRGLCAWPGLARAWPITPKSPNTPPADSALPG